MAVLVTAVVVVAVLAILNLVFTFGVVRRLREHTTILDQLGEGSRAGRTMLGPGRSVAAYAVAAVDGTAVSSDGHEGPMLVGFFSLGCRPCTEKRPVFAERAREYPGGRERVLAVVVGDDGDGEVAPYLHELTPVATVVRQTPTGDLPIAFGVDAYPAFALVDSSGVVLASGSAIPELSTVGTRA
jgi:hypothetical protein